VLDLGEQPLTTVAGRGDVAGEGAQQTDVALGVVVHRPVQVLDVEEPGGLDLLALIGQLARSRMRRIRGQSLAYGVYTSWISSKNGSPPAGKTWVALQIARWPPGCSARAAAR
jgi:hypothetical protein